jgi:hypothetical protein
MHLILRILKFDILREPPIQIPSKKGKNLEFGNYIGVQKPKNVHRVLKFFILRVPPIQIPTKKGKNLEFG